jgi:alanyl-tRNA synthetase
MGDTGPCGPCSEIFYDHGPEVWGGPPGSPEGEGDRYIEIWNLVFMQYNRDDAGKLNPLPKPSVDTGMGLERIAAVLQGVHSNYEIDLFQDLIQAAARETHVKDLASNSLKVIADHIRATSFLIVDGVIPGNEGRGYVLRRIIRRAIRHGYKLGQTEPFFHRLVEDLARVMGEAYPELSKAKERVTRVLKTEEERFAETLVHGMKVLEGALTREDRLLDGETVFQLYDTFGFPVDLTADIARERDVRVDYAGFEAAMQRQRARARAASRFTVSAGVEYSGQPTEFHGYDTLTLEATVTALYREGASVDEIAAGDTAVVVLDRTPFYAESGGQVGDRGELAGANGSFNVGDTQKIQAEVFGHKGELKAGRLRVGERVMAAVDSVARARAAWNHSATHLMHAALRQVLGGHVQQKGSLVDSQRTRFDFSHNEPMLEAQLRQVEALVNHEVRRNTEVSVRVMKYDDAIKSARWRCSARCTATRCASSAWANFPPSCAAAPTCAAPATSVFQDRVRVGRGGGHTPGRGVTAEGALAYVQEQERASPRPRACSRPSRRNSARRSPSSSTARALEKELARLQSKVASAQGDDLALRAVEVSGVKVLAVALDGADAKAMRETLDKLKDKLKSGAVVLASIEAGKVSLIAGVTSDLTAKVKAGELVNFVAQQVGGKGGGRADMAQAGGTEPANLPAALASVQAWVQQKLPSQG